MGDAVHIVPSRCLVGANGAGDAAVAHKAARRAARTAL